MQFSALLNLFVCVFQFDADHCNSLWVSYPSLLLYCSVVMDGSAPSPAAPLPAEPHPWTTESAPTAAEIDARFAQYEQRAQAEEEDEEEEEERIPDLQKDDMMARRTGVFQKQAAGAAAFSRFLPLPGSKRSSQGEVAAEAAPCNNEEVLNTSVDSQHPRGPEETPRHQLKPAAIRATSPAEGEPDEDEHVPDLDRDDMVARRTRMFQKASVLRGNQGFNQFLPVPGSVRCSTSPVSAVKQSASGRKPKDSVGRGSVVTMAAEHEAPPFKAPTSLGVEEQEKGDSVMAPDAAATDVTEPSSSSSSSLMLPPSPPSAQIWRGEEKLEAGREEEKTEDGNMRREKKACWLEDELPPMMVSRRVAFLLDNESVSMGDMANEEAAGHLPSLSPSRYERLHQQYNTFVEEEDHWQDDLARWKNRRRSASQELIKKEEERKRMEKRMKGDGVDSNKRKSIKTYKEIVEEKERREAELCEAYRTAATPEEAAMVLQRYALRFTISDATLDSLKLPRSTNKPSQHLNQTEQEPKQSSAADNCQRLEHPNQPDSDVFTNQEHSLAAEGKMEETGEEDQSGVNVSSSSAPGSLLPKHTNSHNEKLHEPPTHLTEPQAEHQQQPETGAPPPAQPKHTLPSPLAAPSRPLPLLVAKPYCPPRCSPSGHKHVHVQQTDDSVRLNGDMTEDLPSLQDSLQEREEVSSQQTQRHDPPEKTVEGPQTAEQLEKPGPATGSAISSLIAGRNCVITTTIVTELTKTHVEPLHPDVQDDGQDGATERLEAPAEGNTQPAQSPSSVPEYSPTVSEGLEESSVTEQYQKEQEKLKKEWEKAQLEVEEEERKHNEEERRILEETVAPLSPSALVPRQSEHTAATSFSAEENDSATVRGNMSLQQNGQKIHTGSEDQHASKLHFFQDSGCDEQPPKKQEMWKTASLDRSPQMSQTQTVKRSGSHDAATSNQDLSHSTPQPPSTSRCVSGKRLCSGCSKPLGRGAAMIIDTLGLFFHMQCFKCGVCKGKLGDATAGTDVRIRNGLLSCYECYITSRGRGQPTPL